jgi:hypothetical protein
VRARHAKRHASRRHLPRSAAVTLALALLGGAGLAWRASYSRFSATTSNPGDSWTTGTVSLTNNAAVAVFNNITGLIPGSTGTNCILVTYTGSLASTVKFYVQNYSGTLDPYLTMTVQSGSGTSCGAFGTSTTLFSGTLNALRTANTNFANGLPATSPWSPASNGSVMPYQFTYTLADDNAAESATANLDLVWEAQNT